MRSKLKSAHETPKAEADIQQKNSAELVDASGADAPSGKANANAITNENSDAEWTDNDGTDFSSVIEMDGERNEDFRRIEEALMVSIASSSS